MASPLSYLPIIVVNKIVLQCTQRPSTLTLKCMASIGGATDVFWRMRPLGRDHGNWNIP